MNKIQEAFRSMKNKALNCLDLNSKIWEKNEGMVEAVTIVRDKDLEVAENAIIQQDVATGWGDKKKAIREKLNLKSYFVYGTVKNHALNIKNTVLFKQFDKTESFINNEKDTDFEIIILNVQKSIKKYKVYLLKLGLTEKIIKDYDKLAEEYHAVSGHVGEVMAEQVVATQTIATLIDEMREIFDTNIDTYMMQYMLSHPKFYDTYALATEIDDNPVRHHSCIGMVRAKETNEIISGVKIEATFKAGADLANPVKAKSGKKGNYLFKSLKDGMWIFTFRYAGYEDLIITVAIHDGKTTRQDVKLVKKEEKEEEDK